MVTLKKIPYFTLNKPPPRDRPPSTKRVLTTNSAVIGGYLENEKGASPLRGVAGSERYPKSKFLNSLPHNKRKKETPSNMKFSSLLLTSATILGTTTAFAPRHNAPVTHSSTALDATIAVFGASGLTAQECVYQAIKDGDTVIGLTRNPSNVKIPKGSGGADAEKPFVDDKLTVIGGDVCNPAYVDKGKLDIVLCKDICVLSQYLVDLFVQLCRGIDEPGVNRGD